MQGRGRYQKFLKTEGIVIGNSGDCEKLRNALVTKRQLLLSLENAAEKKTQVILIAPPDIRRL